MNDTRLHFLFAAILFFFSHSTISAQCENDTVPPTAHAVNLSTAVLETGFIELYAIDFFFLANDNCTASDSIRYTFSPVPPESDNLFQEDIRSSTRIFDCMDVEFSPISVEVFAWDLAGNYSMSIVSSTFIAPNGDGCDACFSDTIPPSVEMVSELIWPFHPDSMYIEIWASDFVLNAYDNCTAPELIKYSFEPVDPNTYPESAYKLFDCYDALNSPLEIDIYTWDRYGNHTLETSQLYLQIPNGEDCQDMVQNRTGMVIDTKDQPIPGVMVFLENQSGEVLQSTTTNEQGEYTFHINTFQKYVRVEHTDFLIHSINILDMIGIQRYLLGLESFSSAQRLAADINSDGKVRVNDLRMARKFILGILDQSEYIDSDWHFISEDFQIDSNTEDIKDRYPIQGENCPTVIGYRIGDVK